MKLWSDGFQDGGSIPERLAFGRPHPEQHVEFAGNRSPHLAWDELPSGTRSLVLVCHEHADYSGSSLKPYPRTVTI